MIMDRETRDARIEELARRERALVAKNANGYYDHDLHQLRIELDALRLTNREADRRLAARRS